MLPRFLGVALLALALPLGSCSAISKLESAYTAVTTASVSQSKAAALHDAIGLAETTADTYLELPTCASGVSAATGCKDGATAIKVAKALQKVRAADDVLVQAIIVAHTSGTGVGVASTVYNAALSASSDLPSAKN